jgi:hypothetical protein
MNAVFVMNESYIRYISRICHTVLQIRVILVFHKHMN